MVNGILYEKEKNPESYGDKDINPSIKSRQSADNNRPIKNISVDYIRLENENDQVYLEEFYYKFSYIVLPFSAYDTQSQAYYNPARDILLSSAADSNYVLAALLAFGARSKFLSSKRPEDEDYYYLYLLDCVKLLGPAIADDKTLNTKIESVLLTVLFLAAANASNPKQDWRPHLKGAKDLLCKMSKSVSHSRVLIFCKCWFITLEILAGISSNRGGTLVDDEEITELINSGNLYEKNVLVDLGIIMDNGFNIMGGYHNDSFDYFQKLIRILNRKRSKKLNLRDSRQYIKLFAEFQRLSEIKFIDENGVISSNAIGILVEQTPNKSISWMDVSHQSYIQAAMITLLLNCFEESYSSPQVQVLTRSIIKMISFTTDYHPQPLFNNAVMMLQWPALVAGSNVETEEDKEAVRNFFKLLSEAGSGGAMIALNRVEKIWARREGLTLEDDGHESEDLLSY